jgi:hypothetical protein
MSDFPNASPVDSKTPEPVLEMDVVLATLKTLEAADLFKVMKQALAAAEKRSTGVAPRGRATVAAKKTGSMPKGVVPPQLRKPRAWVDFTLQHALENGWESFTVFQTKKDKETGEKLDEEIEMPGSVLHDGAHVYDGSVTDKCPTGKQLIHKDAMSLSKQHWAPKEKKGSHPELYEQFEATYVEETVEADDASVTSSTKKVVVRKTAAEKAAETEAKKAAKEAEKEAKKAEKEAEKEAKKAEKEAAKKPSTKAPVPAAAVKATTVKPTTVKAAAPIKTPVKKVVVAAQKKEEWTCPADGMVHPWPYKGKQYLRNSDGEVWIRSTDGGCGEWQGIYLPAEDRIDDSVPEPVFEDEE